MVKIAKSTYFFFVFVPRVLFNMPPGNTNISSEAVAARIIIEASPTPRQR